MQLFSGLAYLHRQCVIHRDVKPENLLIEESLDEPPKLCIGDFGLACFERRRDTGRPKPPSARFIEKFAKSYSRAMTPSRSKLVKCL